MKNSNSAYSRERNINMNTMEEVREFAANNGLGALKAEDRLKELVQRAADNEQQIADAIETGDVEQYARLTAEKDVFAEMIRKQRDAVANRPKYMTRGDIVAAYNADIERRNAEFCKKKEEYNEAKKRLYELFRELYEARRKMLKDRQTANYLIGDDSPGQIINPRLKPVENFDLRQFRGDLQYRCRNTPADVAFFIESGLVDGNRLDEMNGTFYS